MIPCTICVPRRPAEFERRTLGGNNREGGPYCAKHAKIFWGAHFAVDLRTRPLTPIPVPPPPVVDRGPTAPLTPVTPSKDPLETVLQLISDERARQDQKLGVQNHPSAPKDPRLTLGITGADQARRMCQAVTGTPKLTWAHIAVEELAEAIDEETDEKRLPEIIQTAAVLAAWAENIIRRQTP